MTKIISTTGICHDKIWYPHVNNLQWMKASKTSVKQYYQNCSPIMRRTVSGLNGVHVPRKKTIDFVELEKLTSNQDMAKQILKDNKDSQTSTVYCFGWHQQEKNKTFVRCSMSETVKNTAPFIYHLKKKGFHECPLSREPC